jgi:triosephosphate isomerase
MIKIIAGNWKMNGSCRDIKRWFQNFYRKVELFEKTNPHKEIPQILICPPTVFLPFVKQVATSYSRTTQRFQILVGAQDCHCEVRGSYTGGVSTTMLREFSLDYVLVGHSERRQLEQETSEIVAKKALRCQEQDLLPIICVGETQEARESGKHIEFVAKQVLESTQNIQMTKALVAYEPIWAIGTGKIPSLENIQEMVSAIKTVLMKKTGLAVEELTVLYGGSVKFNNVKEIVALPSLNGLLVGGSSLKGEDFFDIVVKSALSSSDA